MKFSRVAAISSSLVMLIVLLGSCGRQQEPALETIEPTALSTSAGVAFQPPIGKTEVLTGNFDPNVALSFEIFRVTNGQAAGAPVASFSTANRSIKVVNDPGEEEHYMAVWQSRAAKLPNGTSLRVEVKGKGAAAGAPACNPANVNPATGCLGFFDVQLVKAPPLKPLKDFYHLVNGQALPIKVHIEVVNDEHEHEYVSPGMLSVSGASETSFNALNSTIRFSLSGAQLDTTIDAVKVYRNGTVLPEASVQVSSGSVVLNSALISGLNYLELDAVDTNGLLITKNITLWAGSGTLTANVIDTNKQPVANAVVKAKLVDDHQVTAEATSTSSGQVVFNNLPSRTIILEAKTNNNEFGTAASLTNTTVELILQGFATPSSIDNNDFQLGLDGWNLDADGDGTAPVFLMDHVEDLLSSQSRSVPRQTPMMRREPSMSLLPFQHEKLVPQALGTDVDLVLSTSGEGPQAISRTFNVKKGTKNVKVRYRFITSEVPGGYFGTKYNDYFNVSIRSSKGGGAVAESNSMNGLGLAAFDYASGATAWREKDLAVSQEQDTIQVDVTVANVGDGILDSQVVVDLVEEKELEVTNLQLNDIDNTALQYLSASSHTYFQGSTHIHGTITVKGAADDALSSLVLEVLEGGDVVATANLSSTVNPTLLTTFGSDEKVEVTASQLLFKLPAAQAAAVNQTDDGVLTLQVRAKSSNGEEAVKEFGAVTKLVRYTNGNRHPSTGTNIRDEGVGGDDWVKPSVKQVMEHFDGILINDFSNMNGGNFPPHSDTGDHTKGSGADVRFGNSALGRNAATAQAFIDYMNDPTYGSRIGRIGFYYERSEADAFWTTIRYVTLTGNRRARDYIRPWAGHVTHSHWQITD